MEDLIYLDNNATTKLDPRVLEAMMPFLTEEYGNAASNHAFGVSINQHIKEARAKVASLIGSETSEIVFTSGATEAINIALKGVAENYQDKGKHIVTCATEHPAVLDTCKYLEAKGYEITYLPVQKDGLLDLEVVKKSIRGDTILICIMLANNETGVIQSIREIAEMAHEKGAFFMTDGTQAVGKIPVDVNDLGIDLMSFSGHKFYGPKGVGALYVRSRRPNKVKISALQHGGGHERGLRSGTLNVPGIIGLGTACEIAKKEMKENAVRIGALRDYLEAELLKLPDTFLNGTKESRLYNTSSICFRGADADAIMIGIKPIMISNGSACSSTKVDPSHVLKAIGLSDDEAYATIRFSLSKLTSEVELSQTIKVVKSVVSDLRTFTYSDAL